MVTSEFDFRSLEEEFSLTPAVQNASRIDQRDRDSISDTQGDAEKILRLNIERANFLLDQSEQEFANGAINARTLEACAKLISEVTNAANSLKNLEIQTQTLDLKERTLNLKDFEIKNKLSNKEQLKGDTYNTQIVCANREQLLELLNENPSEQILDMN